MSLLLQSNKPKITLSIWSYKLTWSFFQFLHGPRDTLVSSWYTCVLVIHPCSRDTLVSSWYTRVHEIHWCPGDTLVSRFILVFKLFHLPLNCAGVVSHWLGALWRYRWLNSYLYVVCFVSFHLSLVSPKQSRKALRCFPNSILVGRSEKNNIQTGNVAEIRNLN